MKEDSVRPFVVLDVCSPELGRHHRLVPDTLGSRQWGGEGTQRVRVRQYAELGASYSHQYVCGAGSRGQEAR